jgi:hypothetical protein
MKYSFKEISPHGQDSVNLAAWKRSVQEEADLDPLLSKSSKLFT